MPNVQQLGRRLSKQIERVQLELDRLRAEIASYGRGLPGRMITADSVRAMVQARRKREELFPAGTFADPAWDILLILYAGALAAQTVRMADLRKGGVLASATLQRWIEKLEKAGLVARSDDETDRRQTFVQLTSDGLTLMNRVFREMGVGQASL